MSGKRRRFLQSKSLKERLVAFAASARTAAEKLPPGMDRQAALRKARQADTAAHIDEWVNSPGLQPPE